MRLTIERSQSPGPPRASFTVRIGPLVLTPLERGQLKRYGAAPLEAALSAHGGISAIQAAPATASFTDADLARQLVTSLHTACQATETYWRAAEGFHGNDYYESPPD